MRPTLSAALPSASRRRPLAARARRFVDTWDPDAGAPPLAVPLTVFGGESGMVVTRHRLAARAERAPLFRGLYLYGGGHFYLREHPRSPARRITAATIAAGRATRVPQHG
ncbi:hypothetical protein ACWFQ8_24075 [Streptomyces sp. NPDC055254]